MSKEQMPALGQNPKRIINKKSLYKTLLDKPVNDGTLGEKFKESVIKKRVKFHFPDQIWSEISLFNIFSCSFKFNSL